MWINVDPAAHNMCDGCYFGTDNCYSANPKPYALAPTNGAANGQLDDEAGDISSDDARISVAWCAEQMKNQPECSAQFIGVFPDNGHCWCAKTGGDCSTLSADLNKMKDGHFFQSKLDLRYGACLRMR